MRTTRKKTKSPRMGSEGAGMKDEKGLLVVVSGPAGSGKGTVNQKLLETGDFVFSVSATTRAPRPGEVDGVNYHYIARKDFEERIARGELLEHTQYCGNYYGTLRSETEAVLASAKNLLLEIEVEGAMNVKRQYPEAVLIMLLPPSYQVLEARLRGRGTETEDVIERRMARAREELEFLPQYDYIVFNQENGVEQAAAEIRAIVCAEKHATRRNSGAKERFFAGNG